MLVWLEDNVGTMMAAVVLILIVCAVVVKMVKDKKKGKSGCGCNCAHCALSGECHKDKSL